MLIVQILEPCIALHYGIRDVLGPLCFDLFLCCFCLNCTKNANLL